MVGLTLTADAVANLPLLNVNFANALASSPATITVTDAQPGGTATLTSLTVNWGDGTAADTLSAAGGVTHTYAAPGTYTVVVTLANSVAQTVSMSAELTVLPAVAPPPPAGTSTMADLFFSEYIEGTSNNKALEIYNPTTATVNLSSYAVKLYSNGTTTVGNLYTLTGTLSPGGVVVLVNAAAAAAFQTPGSFTTTVTFFNGDDALTLEKSGVVIDRIGQQGNDPGTEWASAGVSTLDRTLRRKPSIKTGDLNATAAFDPSLQWDVLPVDTSSGLGAHTVNP